MAYEDSPFSTAQQHLEDAAGWLEVLKLPPDHVTRMEVEDSVCLEQAKSYVDQAIQVLHSAGTEQVISGGICCEVQFTPIYRTKVVDPEAHEASEAIAEAAKALQLPSDAARLEVADTLVLQLKTLLPGRFNARLDHERATEETAADAYEASRSA